MSNMLGRTGPEGRTAHCCTRHCGKYNMTPKRMKERRQWQKENEEAQADWRRQLS